MKSISIDNGHSTVTPEEAIAAMPWNVIEEAMDFDTREAVAFALAPCGELEFLTEYLRRAEEDLVIG